MSRTIVIRSMCLKELAALCECTHRQLRNMLLATAKVPALKKSFADLDLSRKGRKNLSKAQVKLFLQHNDVIPETITVN